MREYASYVGVRTLKSDACRMEFLIWDDRWNTYILNVHPYRKDQGAISHVERARALELG